jgi:hypothetical protein
MDKKYSSRELGRSRPAAPLLMLPVAEEVPVPGAAVAAAA